MEKIAQYRHWIQQVLTEHDQLEPSYGDLL